MRAFLAAALCVAFFVPAVAQECSDPDSIREQVLGMFPGSGVHDEGEFTTAQGEVYYTMLFRADEATTDFLVIFDGEPGAWCVVDSMEVLKVPDESI